MSGAVTTTICQRTREENVKLRVIIQQLIQQIGSEKQECAAQITKKGGGHMDVRAIQAELIRRTRNIMELLRQNKTLGDGPDTNTKSTTMNMTQCDVMLDYLASFMKRVQTITGQSVGELQMKLEILDRHQQIVHEFIINNWPKGAPETIDDVSTRLLDDRHIDWLMYIQGKRTIWDCFFADDDDEDGGDDESKNSVTPVDFTMIEISRSRVWKLPKMTKRRIELHQTIFILQQSQVEHERRRFSKAGGEQRTAASTSKSVSVATPTATPKPVPTQNASKMTFVSWLRATGHQTVLDWSEPQNIGAKKRHLKQMLRRNIERKITADQTELIPSHLIMVAYDMLNLAVFTTQSNTNTNINLGNWDERRFAIWFMVSLRDIMQRRSSPTVYRETRKQLAGKSARWLDFIHQSTQRLGRMSISIPRPFRKIASTSYQI